MKQTVPYFNEIDLIASICKESFIDFVKEFWCQVPGISNDLVWNWI